MLTANLLAIDFKDVVPYPILQSIALVLMIALIIGYVMYRRKQM